MWIQKVKIVTEKSATSVPEKEGTVKKEGVEKKKERPSQLRRHVIENFS